MVSMALLKPSSRGGAFAWLRLGLVPARLEHREHAIGDRVAAGGIAAPSSTAKNPIACSSTVLALSRAKIPPTTTMPCTKLEPDISGVCRIAGTRPMITQPAKAASMKMYKATKPVIVI